MKKLTARIKRNKNDTEILRSFFENNESSSAGNIINITEDEIFVQIDIDQIPPKALINAICDSGSENIVCFQYEYNNKKSTDTEKKQKPAIKKNTLEKEVSARHEKNPRKKEIPTTSVSGKKLDLDEFAKKANSFEEFIDLVIDSLDLGKREKFFENLVSSALKSERLNWKDITAEMENNKMFYTDWDKVYCANQITSKYGKKILLFLEELKTYKTYWETMGHSSNVSVIPNGITDILKHIDKSLPIEERVKYVLNEMGLEKQNAESQNIITQMANAAVSVEKILSIDDIFEATNIQAAEKEVARLTFATFINTFSNEEVKVLDFLKALSEACR